MSSADDIRESGEPIDHSPQPQIHVEERRLKLTDFLKTVVKVNGSDLHLQADSVPMIRVDGRARFLDCLPPDDELMAEYVKELVTDPEKRNTLEKRGSVDVSFSSSEIDARFRTSVFHSRTQFAIVMRRIIT